MVYDRVCVRVLDTWGEPAPPLTGIHFKLAAGGTPLVGTPICSSEGGSLFAIANAFDADQNTLWRARVGDATPWAGLIVAEPLTLAAIKEFTVRFGLLEAESRASSPRVLQLALGTVDGIWTPFWTSGELAIWNPNEQRTFAL